MGIFTGHMFLLNHMRQVFCGSLNLCLALVTVVPRLTRLQLFVGPGDMISPFKVEAEFLLDSSDVPPDFSNS